MRAVQAMRRFSALQRAEIAEMCPTLLPSGYEIRVSVLFNEPKLLKCVLIIHPLLDPKGFSALQRAEIAEILMFGSIRSFWISFSALQRAEIAEITHEERPERHATSVSVLFNEPKLLKLSDVRLNSVVLDKFQCSSTSRNC